MKSKQDIDLMVDYIRAHINLASIYEQFAEECIEAAKEALKLARIIRCENPTPKSPEETLSNLKEEYTDVIVSARVCGLKTEPDIAYKKLDRWVARINHLTEFSQK